MGRSILCGFRWVETSHSFHLHSRGGSCTGWEQFGGSPWNSAHHCTFLVISQTSVPKKSERLCPRKTGENSPRGGIKTKIWKISSGLFSSLSRQETGGERNVCRLPALMGRRCLAGVGLRRNLPGSSSQVQLCFIRLSLHGLITQEWHMAGTRFGVRASWRMNCGTQARQMVA